MGSHPYISGPNNVVQMIGYLRKNFPAKITSETVKKFSIASNNESYVINALQFIGVIDSEGKRTKIGHDTFVLSDDSFPKAFSNIIRGSYNDLFELRSEEAWSMTRSELISYFRTTDKTSEVIGGRQAGLFQAFRALSGYEHPGDTANKDLPRKISQPKARSPKVKTVAQSSTGTPSTTINNNDSRRDMAMTVRIEINLPSQGTQETYDAIFKSIRANLIDD